MSDTTEPEPPDAGMSQILAIRISDELNEKITASVVASKMPRAAMLRLAIERGLDRLLEQLGVKVDGGAA
jgi:predicted DNA-binding protein